MKNLIVFLLFLSFNASASDFTPTNFETKEEVRTLFSKLWSEYKEIDRFHCYRRAHVLSYQMSKMDINSMKVFFLKGDKMRMDFNWYYHVAPLVYYQGKGVVLDRALLEGATLLEDWLITFSDGKKCHEVKSMDEFRARKSNEACLYLIVPMYYYGPEDLESFNMNAFNTEDLLDMVLSVARSKRDDYVRLYPIPE